MTRAELVQAVKWGLSGGAAVGLLVASAVAGNIYGHQQGMETSRQIWQSHLDEEGCLMIPRTYST